eukprot:TRINITY_DN2736_c0_g1_i2.p1 TRINITY_DN2736_c0_g1~~TRINITY_DN2736_c0_g1_i2.p1  ORF type:complete len:264 (+),score=10.37 TRINITY_DN2736_c0_g1_i2:140-931(+)
MLKYVYTLEVLPSSRIADAMSVLTHTWVGLEPLAIWSKTSYHSLFSIFMGIQTKALSTTPMLSTVITDQKGKIVGVSLNREFSLDYKESSTNPIESLLNDLENVYRTYYASQSRTGKVFYIDSIGVADEAKGKGLATFLILGSLCYAHKLGYTLCVIEATNIYSARICEKLGMRRIAEIKYDNYEFTDATGKKSKVFKGVNKMFTKVLNEKRGKGKHISNAASHCVLYESVIKDILSVPFSITNGVTSTNGVCATHKLNQLLH